MLRKLLAAAFFMLSVPANASTSLTGEGHNVTISASTGICTGNYAVVQVTGANAYYTFNGSTPSSTNGFLLSQNSAVPILGKSLISNFKIIQASSGAALQYFCTDNGGNDQ